MQAFGSTSELEMFAIHPPVAKPSAERVNCYSVSLFEKMQSQPTSVVPQSPLRIFRCLPSVRSQHKNNLTIVRRPRFAKEGFMFGANSAGRSRCAPNDVPHKKNRLGALCVKSRSPKQRPPEPLAPSYPICGIMIRMSAFASEPGPVGTERVLHLGIKSLKSLDTWHDSV
jgi:hypothetical protein